jgi:hypothetical protein
MAAQNEIVQRISLTGSEEIQKQLADLGAAGEKAIGQIQNAASGMSPALSGISNIAATVRNAFAQVGEALAPARAAFTELETAVGEVFTRLKETASIFSIGLVGGLAGGLAGITELIKASAEFGHALEEQSKLLGISVEDLQIFRKEALNAGVDADKLTQGLTRFSQNVGKANEKLFEDAVKLVQMLPAATSQAGVAIVQGIMPVGTAIKTHIIGNIQDTIPQINNLVEVLRTAFSEKGITLPATFFEGVRQNLLNTATSATDAGQKIRLLADSLGVNLPAQTIFEKIQAGADKSKEPLAAVGISFKDLQDNANNLTPLVLKAADGLAQIQNPTERARISLALFSRTWPDVLKALRDGSAGFESLQKSFKGLNEEDVGKLSDTEKALINLTGAATGLRGPPDGGRDAGLFIWPGPVRGPE